MFVSSKWQHVALPTRWCASVRALCYCYLTFLDHRTNIISKVHAPMRVRSAKQVSKLSLGQNKHGQYMTTPKFCVLFSQKWSYNFLKVNNETLWLSIRSKIKNILDWWRHDKPEGYEESTHDPHRQEYPSEQIMRGTYTHF